MSVCGPASESACPALRRRRKIGLDLLPPRSSLGDGLFRGLARVRSRRGPTSVWSSGMSPLARAIRALGPVALFGTIGCGFLVLAATAQAGGSHAVLPSWIEYLSPLPGSDRILRQTNVIIRPRVGIDGVSASSLRVSAAGSLSGRHEGELRTSDDNRTVTFHPDSPFEAGEHVAIRITGSSAMTGLSYELWFEIAGPERDALRDVRDPETEEGVQAASV